MDSSTFPQSTAGLSFLDKSNFASGFCCIRLTNSGTEQAITQQDHFSFNGQLGALDITFLDCKFLLLLEIARSIHCSNTPHASAAYSGGAGMKATDHEGAAMQNSCAAAHKCSPCVRPRQRLRPSYRIGPHPAGKIFTFFCRFVADEG